MAAIQIYGAGLSILLTLVVNPADAQVQRSETQLQTMPQQQAIVPAANKARLANRFHHLSNQYGALKPGTAKYAYAKSTHPALRQTQWEITSTTREIENLRRHPLEPPEQGVRNQRWDHSEHQIAGNLFAPHVVESSCASCGRFYMLG